MKRTYPFTGPGSGNGVAQSQAAAHNGSAGAAQGVSHQPQADYSSYGYGNTTSTGGSVNHDAQQAQWHQQWQQYYAQQAAATAATAQGSPHPGSSAMPNRPSMPGSAPSSYGYGATQPLHQQQQQQPQMQSAYPQVGGYAPQHPQASASTASYGSGAWGTPHPGGAQHYPPPSSSFGQAQYPPPGLQNGGGPSPSYYGSPPANKRIRTENGQGAQYGRANAQSPPYQRQSQQPRTASGPASFPVSHPIPGRPSMGGPGMGAPYASGPSNMAAPMSAVIPPRGSGVPPRPAGLPPRGSRGSQRNQGSNANHAASGSGSGKFQGPQGVNAVAPLAAAGRSGFGSQARNQGSRKGAQVSTRPGSQPGANNGGNSKAGRAANDANRNNKGTIPKGPAADKLNSESGLEMDKAPLLQGRTSTHFDHPVHLAAKRTFTDFKVSLIEIEPIEWYWQQETDVQDGSTSKETASLTEQSESKATEGVTKEESDAAAEGETASEKKGGLPNKKRNDAHKDAARLRISFAANPPPANAPTGPKALVKTAEATMQTSQEGSDEGTKETVATGAKDESADKESTEGTKQRPAAESAEWTAYSRGPPQTSANRLTFTYASQRRRLVIDSDVVKAVEVDRAMGVMRIIVEVKTAAGKKGLLGSKRKDQPDKKRCEEWVIVKGVLLEARNNDTMPFAAVSRRELENCWSERRTSHGDGKTSDAAAEKATGDKIAEKEPGSDATEPVQPQQSLPEGEVVEVGDSITPLVKEEGQDESKGEDVLKGVGNDDSAKLDDDVLVTDDYASLPPFYRLLSQHEGPSHELEHAAQDAKELTITVSFDDSPSQAKWLRTGDVEEWLTALPGMQASLGAEPLRTWASKFQIVDPDPPPTMTEVLDEWTKRSPIGTALHRRQFVQDSGLTSSAAGLSELFARIVSIQSVGPAGVATGGALLTSVLTPSQRDLAGPLQSTLAGSTFDAHHTQISLSILAILGMAREYATLAAVAEDDVTRRLQDLLMCIPMRLLFRSLDGMCKEALDKQRLAETKSRLQSASTKNVGAPGQGNTGRSVGVLADGDGQGAEGDVVISATSSSQGGSTGSHDATSKVGALEQSQPDVDAGAGEDAQLSSNVKAEGGGEAATADESEERGAVDQTDGLIAAVDVEVQPAAGPLESNGDDMETDATGDVGDAPSDVPQQGAES